MINKEWYLYIYYNRLHIHPSQKLIEKWECSCMPYMSLYFDNNFLGTNKSCKKSKIKRFLKYLALLFSSIIKQTLLFSSKLFLTLPNSSGGVLSGPPFKTSINLKKWKEVFSKLKKLWLDHTSRTLIVKINEFIADI